MTNIFLHLHPANVREDAIAFNRTFGLGGMAALLIVIQFLTGIMLRFYYEPFPGLAYDSIVLLQNNVLFGKLIRNIHHWSGVFLVIITFLHLLRTFFTGAYQSPRQVNWIIGLLLFALVIFSNFTGYLLPWDQLAYWAITVSTSILQYIPLVGNSLREFVIAGTEVNADTLLIFYNLHSAVLPILILLLMAYHFWLVRKAGGVIVPNDAEEINIVPSYPNLVYKEGVVALVLIALILVFAVFANAPLLEVANPNYSLNPTKAPWYFAGIQELLMHFHPFFAGFFIPLCAIVLISIVPFLKYREPATGKWFHSEKGKSSSKLSAVFAVILILSLVLLSEYVVNFELLLSALPASISNGLIPLAIFISIIYIYYIFIVRKYKLSRTEAVQAMFVILISSLIILTLIGIFFRGVDMELTFPWNL
ncbi:MAG: cytochrome bc complex cytochrome b subunit [Ignavibacteriaceae bacterium]|nr:cytochrome b N-terminal domain-containing protein [Ignavibacteria bacterium]NNL22274.1 cytochrome bc complex cytochrome b subunit [Ignavibacteriaceae bacterium]